MLHKYIRLLCAVLLIEVCRLHVTRSMFNCEWLPQVCDLIAICQQPNVTDACADMTGSKCCMAGQTDKRYLTVLTSKDTVDGDDVQQIERLLLYHTNINGFLFTTNSTTGFRDIQHQ
jgi:hypothetical protein